MFAIGYMPGYVGPLFGVMPMAVPWSPEAGVGHRGSTSSIMSTPPSVLAAETVRRSYVLSFGGERVPLQTQVTRSWLGRVARDTSAFGSAQPMQHPLGNISGGVSPISQSADRYSFIAQSLSNVIVHRFHSVTGSSRHTYASGWSKWVTFVSLIGTDIDASVAPAEWHDYVSDQIANSAPLPPRSFLTACMCAFLSWLRESLGLTPGTCSNYASAVLFNLRNRDVDVSELSTSVALRDTRAGLLRDYREENEDNLLSAKSTLPFVAALVLYATSHFLDDWPSNMESLALVTAMQLGLMILGRPCEFLEIYPPEGRPHFFRGQDIRFVMKRSTSSSTFIISAGQAHLYATPDFVLVSALPHIRHHKADQEGEGARYVFSVCTSGAFDVATTLFRWARVAQPITNFAFLSWEEGGTRRTLSPESLTKVMKRTALANNLDVTRVTLRSLRYGGATAMVAAGASDSAIQLAGRWKSTAFLRYVKMAAAAFGPLVQAIANTNLFTVHDIHTLCPSHQLGPLPEP
jgi:hypothetical protein